MNNKSKEIARKKHEDSIKYLYFSRYLMVRYIGTIFFFSNLFWLIICTQYHAFAGIIVSLVMTIFAAIMMLEQLSKMHNRQPDVPITRIYLWVQLVLNLILLVLVFTPVKRSLLPFVINNNARWFMLGVLLVGILLAIVSEIRIRNIIQGKDRYKKVINTFQKHQQ